MNIDGWHRHTNGGGWVQDTAHVSALVYVGGDARIYGKARAYKHEHINTSTYL